MAQKRSQKHVIESSQITILFTIWKQIIKMLNLLKIFLFNHKMYKNNFFVKTKKYLKNKERFEERRSHHPTIPSKHIVYTWKIHILKIQVSKNKQNPNISLNVHNKNPCTLRSFWYSPYWSRQIKFSESLVTRKHFNKHDNKTSRSFLHIFKKFYVLF